MLSAGTAISVQVHLTSLKSLKTNHSNKSSFSSVCSPSTALLFSCSTWHTCCLPMYRVDYTTTTTSLAHILGCTKINSLPHWQYSQLILLIYSLALNKLHSKISRLIDGVPGKRLIDTQHLQVYIYRQVLLHFSALLSF